MEHENTDLLKIGDLSRETGLSVSTIKYYVKEGLITPARKTGRNMAYYHPDCIGRLKTIKMLQKERYYPLEVIKQMLSNPDSYLPELDLMDAIHKVDRSQDNRQYTRTQLCKTAGLTDAQLDMLIRCQLIAPVSKGKKQFFSQADYQLALILKRRADAHIPFEQSAAAFRIYEKAMKQATEADVNSFITQGILSGSFTTEELSHMIHVSDQTLDDFISLRRMTYNRQFGSHRLAQVKQFSHMLARFSEFLQKTAQYTSCLPLSETASEAFAQYHAAIRAADLSLTAAIAAFGQAHQFFLHLHPAASLPQEKDALLSYALCAGWFYLGRIPLNCREAAEVILAEFEQTARSVDAAFAEAVLEQLSCQDQQKTAGTQKKETP